MEFVAFEVDRANIGRRQMPDGSVEKRQTAGALCIRWNRHLVERQAGLWICPAYGHTGNDHLVFESGESDGMESGIGNYFRVHFPDDWLDDDRYVFNWTTLKDEADPFETIDYDAVP